MVVFPWPFSPDQSDSRRRFQVKTDVVEYEPWIRWVRERNVLEFKSSPNGSRSEQCARFRENPGLYGEEFQQIGHEHCLVGNDGKS